MHRSTLVYIYIYISNCLRPIRHRAWDCWVRQPTNEQPISKETQKLRKQQANQPTVQQSTKQQSNKSTKQCNNSPTSQSTSKPTNKQAKNGSENDHQTTQKSIPNPRKLLQNRFKICPKTVQNRSWEALGGSRGHLGSKMAPKANISQHNKPFSPQVGVQFGAKIDQKSTKNLYNMASVFWLILQSIFGAIWRQLGSKMGAKTIPKWSQVGCKIDAT